MVSKYKRKEKYNKEMANRFFELCKEGKSLTQISAELGIVKSVLLDWSTDPKKHEFRAAFERGKEACQAYHEDLLTKMVNGIVKCSSKQIDAQIYTLKVKFKEDWSEKQEVKIEVSELDKLNDAQIAEGIVAKLRNPAVAREILNQIQASTTPQLRVVGDNLTDD